MHLPSKWLCFFNFCWWIIIGKDWQENKTCKTSLWNMLNPHFCTCWTCLYPVFLDNLEGVAQLPSNLFQTAGTSNLQPTTAQGMMIALIGNDVDQKRDQCQNKTSQVTLLVARGHTQNLFFPGDRPGERRERRLQCTPHIHLAPLSQ